MLKIIEHLTLCSMYLKWTTSLKTTFRSGIFKNASENNLSGLKSLALGLFGGLCFIMNSSGSSRCYGRFQFIWPDPSQSLTSRKENGQKARFIVGPVILWPCLRNDLLGCLWDTAEQSLLHGGWQIKTAQESGTCILKENVCSTVWTNGMSNLMSSRFLCPQNPRFTSLIPLTLPETGFIDVFVLNLNDPFEYSASFACLSSYLSSVFLFQCFHSKQLFHALHRESTSS